jgi:hypothetical protein
MGGPVFTRSVEGVDNDNPLKYFGVNGASAGGGTGVVGASISGVGVYAYSTSGYGVYGYSSEAEGVYGYSSEAEGVSGQGFIAGVRGTSESGTGVIGTSRNLIGVSGYSFFGDGVSGYSPDGYGVRGQSETGTAVQGTSARLIGVAGYSRTNTAVFGWSDSGYGVHARSNTGLAAFLEGNVEVTGDIRLSGADCAEEFDTSGADKVEPGTVMVLSSSEGALEVSCKAYDKRVAGVVSGASGYKPGIVLDKQQQEEEIQSTARRRMPVALMGKVYCKVDASSAPIEVGDLLTTSLTKGHAMKASDPIKAFGTVIGKALKPLREGRGLIPVLVALQ